MLFKIWAFGKLVILTSSLSCYLTKFNPLQKYQEPCARPCDHHWAPEQEDSFVLAGDQGIFQMELYGLHAQFGRLPYLVMSGKYGYTRLIWQFFLIDWYLGWWISWSTYLASWHPGLPHSGTPRHLDGPRRPLLPLSPSESWTPNMCGDITFILRVLLTRG